jgi:hypothetical protein
MKTTKLLVVTALFTGLTALSYAGPSPEYWARFAQERATTKTKIVAQPPAYSTAANICANCGCPAMKKS